MTEKDRFFYLVNIISFSYQTPPEYQRTSLKKITNYLRGAINQTLMAIQDGYLTIQYKNNMGEGVYQVQEKERVEKMVCAGNIFGVENKIRHKKEDEDIKHII